MHEYYRELFLSSGYSEEEADNLANLAEEAFAFYGGCVDIDATTIKRVADAFANGKRNEKCL